MEKIYSNLYTNLHINIFYVIFGQLNKDFFFFFSTSRDFYLSYTWFIPCLKDRRESLSISPRDQMFYSQ